MKQIQFHRVGVPAEVIECVEVPDPVLAEPDDVLVRVELFPINPADLLTLQGHYPRASPHAPTLGIEAMAAVEAVGPQVTEFAPGDRVILLGGDNWSELKLVKRGGMVRISNMIDSRDAASLKVNPATAMLLLRHFADLKQGDWFLQNAASSSVGRAAIQIARRLGIRTANVVRRPEAAPELKALGADLVLMDDDSLPERLAEATGGAPILFATDAVSGASTNRLASCLSAGGTLVIYGAMSGAAAAINPGLAVFQDIRLRGFWLSRHLATAPRPEILNLYAELEQLMTEGHLRSQIDSEYPADQIRRAVMRAGDASAAGKVLVRFAPLR